MIKKIYETKRKEVEVRRKRMLEEMKSCGGERMLDERKNSWKKKCGYNRPLKLQWV